MPICWRLALRGIKMNTLILPETFNTKSPEEYKKTLEAFCMYVDKLGVDLVIQDLEEAQKVYTEQQNVN